MSLYNKLSKERKELQMIGELPDWITTNSWQMLKDKYLEKDESFRDRIHTIALVTSSYMPNKTDWYNKFYNLLWNGFLIPSTPILASLGRDKGCSVSCSGNYIEDSVEGFYKSQVEVALLSKNGFGTSSYLDAIRPRGSSISGVKGTSSGIVPVFKDHVQLSKDITQGTRRGAWAGYLSIDHPDFYELINWINKNPDDANVGWIISDAFIEKLEAGDKEAIDRYQKSLKLKMVHGKGYFFFADKVNRLAPKWYKDQGYKILASNLCTEIALPSSPEETFTCIISSLNLRKYRSFGEDTIFDSLVFLHCIALDFIKEGKGIKGLEKAVKFTENHMALGLGALGLHTLFQDYSIAYESLEAHLLNIEIFKNINKETLRASHWLATVFGACKVTKGYGVANATRIAIAPNLSSALFGGGISNGREPFYKNAFIQGSASGEMERVNPSLLKLMKDRGVYNEETIRFIIRDHGSVKNVDWLNDHEKEVFKTAFEIDQRVVIRMASAAQKEIDQAQSINLHFSANEDEEYISEVHKLAFKDPYIKSLYYIRSETGIPSNKGECVACGS